MTSLKLFSCPLFSLFSVKVDEQHEDARDGSCSDHSQNVWEGRSFEWVAPVNDHEVQHCKHSQLKEDFCEEADQAVPKKVIADAPSQKSYWVRQNEEYY